MTKIGYLGQPGSYSHQAASQLRPQGEHVNFPSFEELVAAWSLIASERGIDSLDGLLIDVVAVH